MKTINLKELAVYTGVSKTEKVTGDARESFANIVYTRMNGIQAHELAFRLYRSDGAVSVSDGDAQIIMNVARQYCTPAFIDAIEEQLKNQ
jgi:hypothetical protein